MINSENFKEYIISSKFDKNRSQYNSIAIIGCQSSGKSTLLNCLFETNFDTMNAEERVGQTTKGIWVAFNSKNRICILDCEGTDSKERGEERGKFEHCSSLFALALSDVLIINMWSSDVGRYTASNYGVLKIVFEMNLKLFTQECEKKLVIVLRDFNSKQHNYEKIKNMIRNDINNIWKEIRKPDNLINSQPEKFFQIEFLPLPHKIFFEDEFIREVSKFAARFESNHENYIFDHSKSSKNVPADGFHKYCLDIWETILNEKDLNLPSQKEMLATYRCNEIKDQSLALHENDFKFLKKNTNDGVMNNFRPFCDELMKKVLISYDETAKNYHEKIFREIRDHLITEVLNQFYICFTNQGRLYIPLSQKYLKKDIEKELNTKEHFSEVVSKLKNTHLNHFKKLMSDIQISDRWEININSLEEIFDDVISNYRKTKLDEKKKDQIKKIKKQIDDCLINRLEMINQTFWVDFNQDYLHYIYIGFTSFKSYLEEYYTMTKDEFVDYASEMENELYTLTNSQLKKKFKEIHSFASEVFKKKFWNDEKGIPRVWNRIEESEIEILFKKYKKECNELFDLFKTFGLVKNPIKIFNYEKNESLFNEVTTNLEKILSYEGNNKILYKAEEILIFKRKFEDSIELIFEDAKRRNLSDVKTSLPWWGWALIVYLGYDDFLRLLYSYWMIPFTLIIALYGVLHIIGLGSVPRRVIYMLQDNVINKIKSIFNK